MMMPKKISQLRQFDFSDLAALVVLLVFVDVWCRLDLVLTLVDLVVGFLEGLVLVVFVFFAVVGIEIPFLELNTYAYYNIYEWKVGDRML